MYSIFCFVSTVFQLSRLIVVWVSSFLIKQNDRNYVFNVLNKSIYEFFVNSCFSDSNIQKYAKYSE